MKKLTPRTANSMDKLCSLKRDNTSLGDYWCSVDEVQVHLARQKIGEDATEMISIPKRVFNFFMEFYEGKYEVKR